jgi:hypothetical protein
MATHSTTDNHIINDIHLRYRKDKRVIREVVSHPILFTKHRMEDENDWRPIRIRYFGVFMYKNNLDYWEVIKQK